jgi:hypothetical protein
MRRFQVLSVSEERLLAVVSNEASLLRLVSALLMEYSEEWETGKIYLNMKCE